MAHFKRKNFRSSTMKKCVLCGSQRRLKASGWRNSGLKAFLVEQSIRKFIQNFG